MSGDDQEKSTFREILECEDCGATYDPEVFGYSSCDDVPAAVVCPRCFGIFIIAGGWADDEKPS